ncbi:unnamed protein product [Amoebophrya sp. A25]|nr:unnamed protein product [Amoebophrya sp. A25]|eukprot:GSA25T00009308001.1
MMDFRSAIPAPHPAPRDDDIERKLQEGLRRLEDARSLVSAAAQFKGGSEQKFTTSKTSKLGGFGGAAGDFSVMGVGEEPSTASTTVSERADSKMLQSSSTTRLNRGNHMSSSRSALQALAPEFSTSVSLSGGPSSASVSKTSVFTGAGSRSASKQVDREEIGGGGIAAVDNSVVSASVYPAPSPLSTRSRGGLGGDPGNTSGLFHLPKTPSSSSAAYNAAGGAGSYNNDNALNTTNFITRYNPVGTSASSVRSMPVTTGGRTQPYFGNQGGGPTSPASTMRGGTSLLERTKPGHLRDQELRIKQMEFELRNRRLEDEVEGLSRRLEEQKNQSEERDRNAAELAQEAKSLRSENEELYARLERAVAEAASLRQFQENYSGEKAALEDRVKELEIAGSEIQNKAVELEAELEGTQKYASDLEDAELRTTGESEEIKRKLEETQVALCSSTKQCDAYHAELSGLRNALQEQKTQMSVMLAQMQHISQSKDRLKAEKRRAVEEEKRTREETFELEQQFQIMKAQLDHAYVRNGEICKELGTTATGVKVKNRAAKWAREVEILHKWKGKALITIHALQTELKQVQGKYHKYLQYAHRLHQQEKEAARNAQGGAGQLYPPVLPEGAVHSSLLSPMQSWPLINSETTRVNSYYIPLMIRVTATNRTCRSRTWNDDGVLVSFSSSNN